MLCRERVYVMQPVGTGHLLVNLRWRPGAPDEDGLTDLWGAKRFKSLLVLLPAVTPATATVTAAAVCPRYHCRYCWCCCCCFCSYCYSYSMLPLVLSLLLQFVFSTLAGTAAVVSLTAFFARQNESLINKHCKTFYKVA